MIVIVLSNVSTKAGEVQTSALFFTLVVAIILLSGCTVIREQVIYPDNISPLRQVAPANIIKENSVKATIDAPAEDVWKALIQVLSQHAFFTHLDGSSTPTHILSYVDRTSLMLEEFPVVVEMPFHVSVNGDSETTSTMIVTCRWDLITS